MTATTNAAQQWQSHLVSHGAVLKNGVIIQYSDAKTEFATTNNTNVLCDLSHLGLLQISGADAVTFLQGQVTNDVTLLTGKNAHLSAYCNPKGRMLALFLVFAHHNIELGNHLHLQVNRALLEPIIKRLKMYVMRSLVNIKDVSEDIIRIGINGPEAAQILSASLAHIPDENFALLTLDNATILRLPTLVGQQRFEILTDAINAPLIWDALKAKCQLVGKPCWDWLDIQAGLPDIEIATQEQFVPQMLNLDVLDAINFKKGCYTGQEIVARTHYLGVVKRRTYLAELSSEAKAGDKLIDNNQNEVGQIVRVAPNLQGNFDALVELRIDAKESGLVYFADSVLRFKSLPYIV